MENRCVSCGEIIPEGLQICPICEKMNNNDILQAIETLRKISNIETTKSYQELHRINTFNYDLLTAIEALQAQLKG